MIKEQVPFFINIQFYSKTPIENGSVLLLRYFLKLKSLKLQSGVVNSQIDPNSITKSIYCSKLKLLQSFYYLSMGFINLLIDTYNKLLYDRNGLYCQNQYNLCSIVINGLQQNKYLSYYRYPRGK